MKSSYGVWQLWGFAATSALGTVLHFLYDLSGSSCLVAPFSGVNESTWEHMKLLFFPTFIFAIVQSFFLGERRDFWCIKLKGIILGLAIIPIIFYTYNGAIGKSPDWFNISIFFIAAGISYIYEFRQFKGKESLCKKPYLALFALCALALLFVVFTFKTPHLGIFKDPLTGAYGIL